MAPLSGVGTVLIRDLLREPHCTKQQSCRLLSQVYFLSPIPPRPTTYSRRTQALISNNHRGLEPLKSIPTRAITHKQAVHEYTSHIIVRNSILKS